MSDSVRPRRQQPTRLLRPWDSPEKNTGVGCHFLLQCVKVKSESQVARSCPTLRDPMDCSPPGSSAHGIFQARVLEWGAIAFRSLQIAPFIFSLIPYPPNPRKTIKRWFNLLQNIKVAHVTQSFLRLSGSCSKNIGAFFFFFSSDGCTCSMFKRLHRFYNLATWLTSIIVV